MRMAIVAGVLSSVIVGASVPTTGMLQDYPLLTGQALRYALGGVLLLGLTLLRRERVVLPRRRDWLALVALVGFGMLGFNACVLYAQRYAEPGFVAAVLGASPLVLALVAPLLAGRRPALMPVVGAGAVVAGVVALSGGGAWHGPGLVLAVLTMVCEASFTLFAVGVVRRLGGVAVSMWCCFIAAAVGGVVGSVVGGWRVPTVREGAALVVLGVLVTAVAFVLWYFAMDRLGADRAGVLVGLMPVAGLVAAVALGAQQATLVAFAGAVAVAGGCAVGLWRRGARVVSDESSSAGGDGGAVAAEPVLAGVVATGVESACPSSAGAESDRSVAARPGSAGAVPAGAASAGAVSVGAASGDGGEAGRVVAVG
ncbi:DMT family transporter [Saccharothrix violaceirubra]|uniref:Drug/metabolite transporter (DMT)-like permease n=1 Tax=Saccharothrix violaceirubra TaxID=413306 RepID=A0A7W7T8F0_9PSEU|nr:DMT family transporter [Saccharothrix violaceirubra]MBB4968474.1 drug/metabolite transporter (DMT)-like permease [Saccharothrix violaceirubra]